MPFSRLFFATATLALFACGSATGSESRPQGHADPDAPDGEPSGADDGTAGSEDPAVETPDGEACATVNRAVELLPVHLAFAFDVSGSMGKGDEDWHDKALKWDPVVLATRAFFEDESSAGLTASLTFFPVAGDQDDRCESEAYTSADVASTQLPSAAFGAAIDAVEPASQDDWRGGTPTRFVMEGTRAQVAALRAEQEARMAIVLVTDGYPQGCDDESDEVQAVVREAEQARSDQVDTYVIGVANPPLPGAPDTVSDLDEIAAAGGTEHAFLIDTGDPQATSSAFAAAVNAIRDASIGCELPIPEPPEEQTFDKQKVAVHYDGSAGSRAIPYDARCAGEQGWHYDDAQDPRAIILCPSSCATVKADPRAALEVQFACESTILVL